MDDCSNRTLSQVIGSLPKEINRLFIGDGEHSSRDIPKAVIEAIPSLRKAGIKHLFIEVSDHLQPALDKGGANRARLSKDLAGANRFPDLLVKLVQRARAASIEVHFADDRKNMDKLNSVTSKVMEAEGAFRLSDDDMKEIFRIRSEIDPYVAAKVNALPKDVKAAVFYGEAHMIGPNDLNERIKGNTFNVSLYPDAKSRMETHDYAKKMGYGTAQQPDTCVDLAALRSKKARSPLRN